MKLEQQMKDISNRIKLKKDRYRSARGGEAHLLDIFCSNCNSLIIKYQKDGRGGLLRCYLNRILFPPDLEALQYHYNHSNLKNLPNLTCQSCKSVIGTPMVYTDGRIAYRLQIGNFQKKLVF